MMDTQNNVSPELEEALFSLQGPGAPADFAAGATETFRAAHLRRTGQLVLGAVVAAILVCTPIVWAVALNWHAVVVGFASMWAGAISTIGVVLTLWSTVPELGTGLALALCLMMFLFGVPLARMFQTAPAMK